MKEIQQNRDFNLKVIDSLHDLDNFLKNESLEQFEWVKIQIVNEKLNIFKQLKQKLQQIPSLQQLCLTLIKTELNNAFISDLMVCLNDLSSLQQVDIKMSDNSFSLKQSKRFILYIQQRFFPSSDIECTYIDYQFQYRCDRASISFNNDFEGSVFIKEGLTKKMKVIIPRDYPEFYAFTKQCIQQEIENIQVVINYKNKKFAICQSNVNHSLLYDIYIQDEKQIINYIYNKHDIVLFKIQLDGHEIQDRIKFNKQRCLEYYNQQLIKEIFVIKNKLLSKNQKKFIQKEFIENIDKVYFENNFQFEIVKQHILPELLIENGQLKQNIIKFNFINDKKETHEYVSFILTENDSNDQREINFYFYNIDQLTQLFNSIFSTLQQYQLVLYKVNLQIMHPEQYDNKTYQNLQNIASIQYKIKKFTIMLSNKRYIKTQFSLPIIEEIQCLEELKIFTTGSCAHIFLDKNMQYLQKNKSKDMFHLILDDYYSRQYIAYKKINNQVNLTKVNKISTNSNYISVKDFTQSKRLVQFEKYSESQYSDDDYYEYADYDYQYSDYDSDDYYYYEEIYNYKDITIFYD